MTGFETQRSIEQIEPIQEIQLDSRELMSLSGDKKEKLQSIENKMKSRKEIAFRRQKKNEAMDKRRVNQEGLQLAERIESGQATEQETKDFLNVCQRADIKPNQIAKIVERKNGQVLNLSSFSETKAIEGKSILSKKTAKELNRNSAIWDKTFLSGDRINDVLSLDDCERFADLVEMIIGSGESYLRNAVQLIHDKNSSSIFNGLFSSGLLNDAKSGLAVDQNLIEWMVRNETVIKGGKNSNKTEELNAA